MSGEVPEGWKLVQLSSIVVNKTTKWNENSNGESYIGLEHISQEAGTLCGVGSSSDVVSAKNTFEIGDVLFGKLRPNLKKYWHATFSGICSTDILVLRPSKEIRSDFLFALVQSNQFLDLAISDAVGTKMPRTSWSRLGELNLNLPPLPEQQRIAEILFSVDESIRATEVVIAQAERVKRGLMEDLLTGGLGSAAIANGEVPEGWEAATFGEVFDFKGGNQPPKDTFVYEPTDGYVRLLQIRDFESDDRPAYIPKNSSKARCEKSDILIARYGASLGRILKGMEGAYNVALVKLIFERDLDRDFAFYWLNSEAFQTPLFKVGSRSAQAGFNKSDLAPFPILLPPLYEQRRAAETLSSVDNQITSNRATVEQLHRLKRGLMDDLLTGKVRTAA